MCITMKRMFLCFKKGSISYLEIYKIPKDLIDSYFRITSITMAVNKAICGILKYENYLEMLSVIRCVK